jgi:hypothetical protein
VSLFLSEYYFQKQLCNFHGTVYEVMTLGATMMPDVIMSCQCHESKVV